MECWMELLASVNMIQNQTFGILIPILLKTCCLKSHLEDKIKWQKQPVKLTEEWSLSLNRWWEMVSLNTGLSQPYLKGASRPDINSKK